MSPLPELDKIGRRVPQPHLHALRAEVARLLRRNNEHFPGAQPVSFARRHLEELRTRDYYVCEKSDGIRCLLYFSTGRDEHGEPCEVHYLIDRKNDYYAVDFFGLHTPLPPDDPAGDVPWDSYHTDTLLDGELVVDVPRTGENKGRPLTKYYVFDSLAVDGRSMLERPLDKRLAYFMEKVYKPYAALVRAFPEDAAGFVFSLCQKQFEFSYGTSKLFQVITPGLEHDSDGVIFTCRETPYTFGTDANILKWKPANENTIDFRMTLEFPALSEERADAMAAEDPSGAVWEWDFDALPEATLHVNHGESGGYQPFAALHLPAETWEAMKAHAEAEDDGLDGAVVECFRDEEGRWCFHRFRDDKTDGNHVSVVHKVLESIDDGVAQEQLIANEGSVRAAWKSRAQAQQQQQSMQTQAPR